MIWLVEGLIVRHGRHYQVHSTGMRPKVMVSGGGRGVVGHAGSRLLADLADATGLTHWFGDALSPARQRRGRHDPGRVAVDLSVVLADGGEAIADLAVLRNQPELFGAVASDATAWRVLSVVDEQGLARLRMARAAAREVQVREWRSALACNPGRTQERRGKAGGRFA